MFIYGIVEIVLMHMCSLRFQVKAFATRLFPILSSRNSVHGFVDRLLVKLHALSEYCSFH